MPYPLPTFTKLTLLYSLVFSLCNILLLALAPVRQPEFSYDPVNRLFNHSYPVGWVQAITDSVSIPKLRRSFTYLRSWSHTPFSSLLRFHQVAYSVFPACIILNIGRALADQTYPHWNSSRVPGRDGKEVQRTNPRLPDLSTLLLGDHSDMHQVVLDIHPMALDVDGHGDTKWMDGNDNREAWAEAGSSSSI